MIIDINKLEPNSRNPNSMTELKFNALIKSIKEEKGNRLFPIEVLPEKDGKYIIIDGEHRYRALIEAGIKDVHIEVSDLKKGYEKLRTISKNSIHGTHDQIKEAELIKSIKEDGITDSEIMSNIGIDEAELIAIDNLANFDADDFLNGDEDIELDEDDIEVDDLKELTLKLKAEDFDLLMSLQRLTDTMSTQEAILVVANYFSYFSEVNRIDQDVLKTIKESKFGYNSFEDIDF